jgi:hypothetical protein
MISCGSEGSAYLSALVNLVNNDYNDSQPGGYDYGISKMLNASGVSQRLYSGANYYGPVSESSVANANSQTTTLNSIAGGWGITSQNDVSDTVWVLLYGPNDLKCPNPSTNGMSAPGGTGYGSFPIAFVSLQDYGTSANSGSGHNNYCGSSDFDIGAPTPVTDVQFATFAASHEIDENLTNPYSNTGGWTAGGHQIADDCNTTDGKGNVGYSAYPNWNFTRDLRGTIVAAYVTSDTSNCFPDVSTGVPPG